VFLAMPGVVAQALLFHNGRQPDQFGRLSLSACRFRRAVKAFPHHIQRCSAIFINCYRLFSAATIRGLAYAFKKQI
jgi:hypothetical protein